jgi:beta-lactamase regulating signal transducer with metallopeptidase domain
MTVWAAESLFGTTLLMLIVLLLRRPVAHLFGAGWAYALWLLPALRLVLPPLPFDSNIVPNSPAIAFIPAAGDMVAPLPSLDGSGQWMPIMLALWAGGAAAFMIWQWLSYRAFVARLLGGCAHQKRTDFGGIEVIESATVQGPIAVGILHRRIAVPAGFEQHYSPAEQLFALQHELVHHRRGDLWWNVAALFILALNWFNPIAWISFRAFRADQELACDAAVARSAPAGLHDYATALVKSASRPGLIAACPLNHADQLKRRLKMMKHHRTSTFRTLGGAAALGTLLLAGLGLSAPGFAQEKVEEKKVLIKKIDKDGKVTVLEGKDFAHAVRNCPSANQVTSDVTSGDEKEKHRTRITICSKDGTAPTPEMREKLVAALETAMNETKGLTNMTPERRSQALEALQREMDRIRQGK